MKDVYKGITLLLLAGVASVISLSVEDRHWNMPFVKFDATPESTEIRGIQAQILAGLDPSTITQPTAAGKAALPTCYQGKIARDKSTDLFSGVGYLSVKEFDQMYIQVKGVDTYLLRGAFETQSASVIEQLPANVLQRIEQAGKGRKCAKIDMYLAKIKR
ncbi:MAG: hypothetical protein MJK10_07145 [Pseudomonadales bacterium]|nr:hypothetical protein [Pseudomonadales bacterium]NRA13923.1 hypothetical protein [Oceanospirillaceae bacterium]